MRNAKVKPRWHENVESVSKRANSKRAVNICLNNIHELQEIHWLLNRLEVVVDIFVVAFWNFKQVQQKPNRKTQQTRHRETQMKCYGEITLQTKTGLASFVLASTALTLLTHII